MDVTAIAFLTLITFSTLATFFLTLKFTGKVKYAILGVLFLVKFIAIFGYLFSIDKPLFSIILIHRKYNIVIFKIGFTVNLMVFLSSLIFTAYILLAPKLYHSLPYNIRDIIVPKWIRE